MEVVGLCGSTGLCPHPYLVHVGIHIFAVKAPSTRSLHYLMPTHTLYHKCITICRPDMFNMYGASEAVISCIEELIPLAGELQEAQMIDGVDLPVRLDASLGGLVESWALGCEWSELCQSTSLDQGDVCRLLRRTMEVLRQVTLLPTLPKLVRDRARRAVDMMDRFPVSDDASFVKDAAISSDTLLLEDDDTDDTDDTDNDDTEIGTEETPLVLDITDSSSSSDSVDGTTNVSSSSSLYSDDVVGAAYSDSSSSTGHDVVQ
jgi:DSHCT (NUC185) domain